MPIYEYECPHCGKTFEVLRSEMECVCPSCGEVCWPRMSRYNFKCPLN
ncbi:MAG: FmdB family zinc ribbon protein [Dehalococcoidia bacterium]